MHDRNVPCTACFPAGSRPACRVFDNSSGALTIYSGLHATGNAPSMCLQADQRFRVCHLSEPAVTMPPPVRVAAA